MGTKMQLPNVLVNIHKNMSVLLNPQQTIIIRPPTPCIFLLLILLSALNSFPQLLLFHSCVSELLPVTLAFAALHASLWYPLKSSGPLLPAGDINDTHTHTHQATDAAVSHFKSLFLGNTTIILPRN